LSIDDPASSKRDPRAEVGSSIGVGLSVQRSSTTYRPPGRPETLENARAWYSTESRVPASSGALTIDSARRW